MVVQDYREIRHHGMLTRLATQTQEFWAKMTIGFGAYQLLEVEFANDIA